MIKVYKYYSKFLVDFDKFAYYITLEYFACYNDSIHRKYFSLFLLNIMWSKSLLSRKLYYVYSKYRRNEFKDQKVIGVLNFIKQQLSI